MKLHNPFLTDIKKIKPDVFSITFGSGYLSKKAKAGQFLHIKINSRTLLRRPLSIHRIKGDRITLLFRVRGIGTQHLSQYAKGQRLDILGPLGNGFVYTLKPQTPQRSILLGGGMGVAPLVFLAQQLRPSSPVTVLLGAKTKKDVLCEDDFKKLGCNVRIATDDGSKGYKGTVTNLLKKTLSTMSHEPRTNLYACGPTEMFAEIKRALKKFPKVGCQVSFEQFMGCGVGLCYGCVIKTRQGYKRVCKDGPVFDLKEITFS